MYKHVLVPIDGSDTARLGLNEAIKLAKLLQADIRLIYVVDKLSNIPPEAVQAFVDQLRGDAESVVHEAIAAVRDAGIAVDNRLIEALGSEAGECIVNEAVSWPADLIVCGTHGRRGVRRILMGSDAEYILRRSPVPVLMIRDATASESGPNRYGDPAPGSPT
jgi:nucleotide-binding universal stress UspA family protein